MFLEHIYLLIVLSYVHEKNDFAEIFKNLARSKNNFIKLSK